METVYMIIAMSKETGGQRWHKTGRGITPFTTVNLARARAEMTRMSNRDYCYLIKVGNLELEELQKQKPMQAIENYNWCDLSEDEQKEDNQWFCPKCNATVEESYGYCVNCGQKIDWEEE